MTNAPTFDERLERLETIVGELALGAPILSARARAVGRRRVGLE